MSDAADIKRRFSLVRLRTARNAQLDELVRLGKWKDAQTLGVEIGLPVSPRGSIIDLQARRRACD